MFFPPLFSLQIEHIHINALERDKFIWSLSNVPLLESYIGCMEKHPLKDVVVSVIHQYKTSVVPKYSYFRKCKYDM